MQQDGDKAIIFWTHRTRLRKAEIDYNKGTISVWDENKNRLYIRKKVSRLELKRIAILLHKKQILNVGMFHAEPSYYGKRF